jgi:hypothetical protein
MTSCQAANHKITDVHGNSQQEGVECDVFEATGDNLIAIGDTVSTINFGGEGTFITAMFQFEIAGRYSRHGTVHLLF